MAQAKRSCGLVSGGRWKPCTALAARPPTGSLTLSWPKWPVLYPNGEYGGSGWDECAGGRRTAWRPLAPLSTRAYSRRAPDIDLRDTYRCCSQSCSLVCESTPCSHRPASGALSSPAAPPHPWVDSTAHPLTGCVGAPLRPATCLQTALQPGPSAVLCTRLPTPTVPQQVRFHPSHPLAALRAHDPLLPTALRPLRRTPAATEARCRCRRP